MTSAGGNGWKPSDELIDAGLAELKKGFSNLFKGMGQGVKEEVKTASEKVKDTVQPPASDGVDPDPVVLQLQRIANVLERIEQKLPEPTRSRFTSPTHSGGTI